MNKSIISFTKIDIVQLKVNGEIKHELPTDDFVDRLKNSIISDVSKNQVIYDTKNGSYEIFHNGKKYVVYYGNREIDKNCEEIDTLQILQELVQLTNSQKIQQDFDGEVKEEKKRTIEEIVENGDEGIFYCEDDKLKYIEAIKKRISEESIFTGLSEVFKKSYDARDYENGWIGLFPGIISVIGGIALTIITQNPVFLFGLFGVISFIGVCETGYSLINSLLQFLYRLVKWPTLAMVNLIKKLRKKKRLQQIKNSVIESELSEYMSDKLPEEIDKLNEKENSFTLKGEAKDTIRKILAKLPLLKDKSALKEFADQLDELVDMCRDVPDEEYNTRYSEILYQLSKLDGNLSDRVKEEISKHVINTDHNKTKEVIESVSSVQMGGKR